MIDIKAVTELLRRIYTPRIGFVSVTVSTNNKTPFLYDLSIKGTGVSEADYNKIKLSLNTTFGGLSFVEYSLDDPRARTSTISFKKTFILAEKKLTDLFPYCAITVPTADVSQANIAKKQKQSETLSL